MSTPRYGDVRRVYLSIDPKVQTAGLAPNSGDHRAHDSSKTHCLDRSISGNTDKSWCSTTVPLRVVQAKFPAAHRTPHDVHVRSSLGTRCRTPRLLDNNSSHVCLCATSLRYAHLSRPTAMRTHRRIAEGSCINCPSFVGVGPPGYSTRATLVVIRLDNRCDAVLLDSLRIEYEPRVVAYIIGAGAEFGAIKDYVVPPGALSAGKHKSIDACRK